MKITKKNISRKKSISVQNFYELVNNRFKVKIVNNKIGFDRLITEQNLHRPGLALAGFVDLFAFKRIQIFGNTEMRYLYSLSKIERQKTIDKFFEFEVPCIIITNNNKPTKELVESADKNGVTIFKSEETTTKLVYLIGDILDDQFAPRITLHGSFVDVYGIGILFTGKSGVGKSEVALDLIERGHRLVADDVVILTKKGEEILMGSGTDLVKHFMEIRGVGIIDVQNIFGIRSIRYQKRLEIIIELELWDPDSNYTRTGLENRTISIQGVEIPHVKLPIVSGKNITVITEVIALNYLLKHYGYNAAEVFQKNLKERLSKSTHSVERNVEYFEHDFE